LRDAGRTAPHTPTPRDSHEALAVLLANTRKVFEAFEASLTELDAWRHYFSSGY